MFVVVLKITFYFQYERSQRPQRDALEEASDTLVISGAAFWRAERFIFKVFFQEVKNFSRYCFEILEIF